MSDKKNKALSLFVSIPHSGLKIPGEAKWLKPLSPSLLLTDVDLFVDELYSPSLKEFNIPSVLFPWHRYAVDANRFADNISPRTVEESRFQKFFIKNKKKGAEFSSDIHWHKTTKGELLIPRPLSKKLHRLLIKKYFDPFHEEIKKQIKNFEEQGSRLYLLDLHSMPSQGLNFHRDPGGRRKDIVIGNCEGKSGSEFFTELVIEAYKKAGFETALNWPYRGGAITQTYGQPQRGWEALQVELNRSLYMDEKTKNKNSRFKEVQGQLRQALAFIQENQERL